MATGVFVRNLRSLPVVAGRSLSSDFRFVLANVGTRGYVIGRASGLCAHCSTGVPMSTLFRRSFLVAAMLTAAVASAQNPTDLLNKAKGEQAIITQKIELKLREAINDARRLQATSPIRAVNALKTALAQLDDPLVPPTFRTQWTAQIQTQIKAIESGKPVSDPVVDNPIKR